MARAPQARAPQASAEDDFYGQDEDFDAEGADDRGQEGQEDPAVSEGAALDVGEEQEAGSEDALGGEDEFESAPPRRGEQRLQRLANENRRLADRVAEMERSSRPAGPAQPTGPREETDAEFEARIQLLAGDERADARIARFTAQQQRRDHFYTVQAAAAADRNAYNEKAQLDPDMRRLRSDVEAEFNRRLQAGQAISRIDLYYWLDGKNRAEERVANPKRAKQLRDQARERVNRNTVRPSQGGSDVRPQRRGTDERTARAKRLDGVQI